MSNNVVVAFMSRSILHTHQFSWVFLVDWIMIMVLAIFVLFYFNNLLGFVVTQTFCRYLWYRKGIYLKIQSIQISLLGGRILFRNVVYIGTSQAYRIVWGTLNWRYWVSDRRKSLFIDPKEEESERRTSLQLNLAGLEWFIYNREVAYDVLAKQEPVSAQLVKSYLDWEKGLNFLERKVAQLLPLRIKARDMGIIIGNDELESLLTLASPKMDAVLDMAQPSNKFDRYRHWAKAKFACPELILQENPDYKVSCISPEQLWRKSAFGRSRRRFWMEKLIKKTEENPDQPWLGLKRYMDKSDTVEPTSPKRTNAAANDKQSSEDENMYNKKDSYDFMSISENPKSESNTPRNNTDGFSERAQTKNGTKSDSPSVKTTSPRQDPKTFSRLAALPVEYAKVSQLFTCDSLELTYQADVVGRVEDSKYTKSKASIVNSEKISTQRDPIFDVLCNVQNGKVNYGPYAERQRKAFYSVFFPRNCEEAETAPVTSTGTPYKDGWRMHPLFTISIRFVDEATIVIPIREASKDDEFANAFLRSLQAFEGDVQRTYGWLEIRAGRDSRIDVFMPLLPNSSGYSTEISLDLRKPDVRSSINHDTMFCAKHHSTKIVLHQPLLWNAVQVYNIRHKTSQLEFYALREHVTLIGDMINDFAVGPTVPYALFTPAVYNASWDVTKLSLFLNVNKGNIINQPTNLSENTFLIFRAPELHVCWNIPRTQITSPFTSVNTILDAPIVDLELNAPNWHTLNGFLDWQRMARVNKFKVQLQHHMTTIAIPRHKNEFQVEPIPSQFVDTQILDVSGDEFAMTAHGFFIDYIMRIQENYFGQAYHFQTTEEFLQKRTESITKERCELAQTDVESDIQMRVRVNKGCFLIPTRLYSCKDCISFHFMQMNLDCRFTNYYMDLQIEIAPLTGRLLHGLNPGTAHEEALQASGSFADVSISLIEGHAHRMLGLPPSEPSYVVKWDFDIGDITADFPLDFASAFISAMAIFGHAFRDVENKPVLSTPELNDVVFVSCNVASIDAVIRPPSISKSKVPSNENDTRFQLLTSKIKLRLNDLANNRYSAHRSVDIAFIGVKGFVRDDVLALDVQAAIHTTTFINKRHSKTFYDKQQSHIALHDIPFNRARFLVDNKHREKSASNRDEPNQIIRPYIPITPFDPPLTRDNLKFLDPQFAAVNGHCGSSDMESEHTSLESLVNAPNLYNSSIESESSYEEATSILRKAKRAKTDKVKRGQDVFPFSSSTTTAERERLRSKKSNFELSPSPWHPRSPKLLVDDEVDNNSIVIQILPIKASFTPELVHLVEAFENDANVDFEEQLDLLQIDIVRSLMEGEEVEEVVRFHLITELITIDFSESIKSLDRVRLTLREVDCMVKLSGSQRGVNILFQSLSVALRYGSQDSVDLTTINAATLELSKFSFLWQVTSHEDGTGSLNLDSVDVSFAASNVEWAIQYIAKLMNALPQTRRNSEVYSAPNFRHDPTPQKQESQFTLTKQYKLRATFFALTMAGERMGVEQESYVLSRPSGAIQSQAHVRSRTSWRLVVRLRYLLQRLPPSERLRMQKEIQNGTFKLPYNAKEQSVAVYRKWRSWEQSNNIGENEIFRLVFDDKTFQEYVMSLSTSIFVSIDSMVARVVYPDMHDHFAGLDSLQMQLVLTRKNDVQSLNLTFRCGKARARAGLDLLGVVGTIVATLSSLSIEQLSTEQKLGKISVSSKESLVDSTTSVFDMKMDEGKSSSKALQASVSIFILDLILEFDFATLRIETQNHQIQFTTSVESMESSQLDSLFHTGTLVTSDGAFRIHERKHAVPKLHLETEESDVLDSLIQGVSLGYASRGIGENSNTWATLNLKNASLITHPTAVELTNILVDFLETDLKVIQTAAEDLQKAFAMHEVRKDHKNHHNPKNPKFQKEVLLSSDSEIDHTFSAKVTESSTENSTESSDASRIVPGGKYLNLNVESMKCRIRLAEELRFVLQSRKASLRMRKTDALVTSVDFGRCALGIHFGDGSAAVANTQLENLRSVLRFDAELMALAVFNNVGSIRLETMSLAWILEYLKNRNIDKQIEKVLKNADRMFDILNERALSHRSSPVQSFSSEYDKRFERPTKMRLRLVNRASKISITLPLDTSSFMLTITGVRLHYENFETFQELETQILNSPETMGAGIDDFKLELLIARTPVREIIKLNFHGSVHRERGESLVNAKSDYIRFALDPEAVGAIFVAVQKIKERSMTMLPTRDLKSSEFPIQQSGISSDSGGENNEKSLEKLLGLDEVRAKLLMQYLTITWYTGLESTEGLVLGLDKLQVIVAKLMSHTELAGAYITPVSSSKMPVKDRLNTAYLPLVNINALVAQSPNLEKPSVKADINGKSIVVSLTPKVAFWVMALVDSFVKAGYTVEQLVRKKSQSEHHSGTSRASKPADRASSSSNPLKPLELLFDISINMHFDRGILRLLEDSPRVKEPALELFSPTLDMIIELFKRKLMLRIDASRTNNQIFPKAISEVKAMISMIALSMKQRAAKNLDQEMESHQRSFNVKLAEQKNSEPTAASSILQEGFPPNSPLFERMELDVYIHFGPQELYLSCLPFGKVGAMMSTDGMDVLMVAPQSDSQHSSHTSIYGLIKKSKISLQHMYSHDVSAIVEFQYLAFLGIQNHNRPYKMAVNLNDPQIYFNLSKLYDMRTFIDIWALFENSANASSEPEAEVGSEAVTLRRMYSTVSSGPRPIFIDVAPTMLGDSTVEVDEGSESAEAAKSSGRDDSKTEPPLIDKYKKAMTLLPFAFLANLIISNIVVVIGLGPAIGEVRIIMNRCWLAALQTASNCQILNARMDTAKAQFEGRLGGALKLENLMGKIALQWCDTQSYPLVQFNFRLKNFGFYFSLDFHPFIAGDMKDLVLMLMTQDCAKADEDRLHVAMKCESISVALTALLVAHTMDVISLFQRLQSQISNVPLQIHEVAKEKAMRDCNKRERREQRIAEHQISRSEQPETRVLIDIHFGKLLIHLFPTEFVDNTALKVYAQRFEVHFDGKNLANSYETGLDLAVHEGVVGLVNVKGGGYSRTLTDLDYEYFIEFVGKSSMGSTILHTPEVTVLMDTWNDPKEPGVVYFTFSNEVHGSIEVGWNLGSVNFIKEMVNTHKNAWVSRQSEASLPESEDGTVNNTAQAYRQATAKLQRAGSLPTRHRRLSTVSSALSSTSSNKEHSSEEMPGKDESSPEITVFLGINYVAKRKPIILIPQLHDLGDATPPIEWLGVNRERIPMMLHYFLTREIQQAANEIEKAYLGLIGRL